jgi:N-acetyltransferase
MPPAAFPWARRAPFPLKESELNTHPVLEGAHVRLEPLAAAHVESLVKAAQGEAQLFRWTTIPDDLAGMSEYVAAALREQDGGSAVAFATVRRSDGVVVGSTRFFLIERWAWPQRHPQARRAGPDGCEIGYTWLNSSAVRTAINTEAKYLMLRHAFEVWDVHRVCFHTDARNERSCNALLGIGARFEGILRAHRLASDLKPRDSARYSIIASEWPGVSAGLRQRLQRRPAS